MIPLAETPLEAYRGTVVIGDTHGALCDSLFQTNSSIIHVGDYGIGFSKDRDHRLTTDLSRVIGQHNSKIYVNRGNHDNPRFWAPGYDGSSHPNVEFVPSYQTRKIGKETVLFLGGAVSIDRSSLLEDVKWWRNEGFDFSLDFLKNPPLVVPDISSVTLVVSHSAPSFCIPVGYADAQCTHWIGRDPALERDLESERDNLAETFYAIKRTAPNLRTWAYGHFHPDTFTYECVDGIHFHSIPIEASINVSSNLY